MEYPIWQLTTLAGGFWIALIAVVHVYVAHFAVGGGLFLVLTEIKARRENSPVLLDYVKRHAKFFLLLTMVFGGVTGVAIWVTISLLSPQATSTLIHAFVFGWAAEWVCFLGEIVALLVYYYAFERMDRKDHLRVGWLYFVFAWLSLFLINGIIGFMLTPGRWPASRDFWDGFFNPSFWPSLFFRTFLSLMIAGLFGFLTATRIKDQAARLRMVRSCALWTVAPFALFLLSGLWYFKAMPAEIQDMIWLTSARIGLFLKVFFWTGPLIVLGGLVMAVRIPERVRPALAFTLLALGLFLIGSFEFVREAGRKPYLVHGLLYSNSIFKDQQERIEAQGILKTAKWAKLREVTPGNRIAAGREIFRIECSSCHSIGGPMNDIRAYTAGIGATGIEAYLAGQGKLFPYMPPFLGTAAEREALAAYIAGEINGLPEARPAVTIAELPLAIPPFDATTDEYVLLAWNTLGMKCISDCDASFSLLPPGNALNAVLVRRGEQPTLVTQGVALAFEVEANFRRPSAQVEFWKYAPSLIGKELAPDTSATGLGLAGDMKYNEKTGMFEAVGIPIVPYGDDGSVNPYPLCAIVARDAATGRVLARTQAVLPVGSEMGCHNCHGGGWGKNGVTGISAQTARGILAVHDKRNRTDLSARARSGKPVLCQSCHPDPLLNAKGRPELLNLPAAIHGFHVNYLPGRGDEVCANCHPDSPRGVTRCLRDNHAAKGLSCHNCHGFLEDHALSLLKAEQAAGKQAASRLMANVKPRLIASLAAVNPRTPWVQEPDCLTCHKEYGRPDAATASSYNTWTKGGPDLYRNRRDEMGMIPCAACHGSPHATYPTASPYGKDRDNIQPVQYMGVARVVGADGHCTVCHAKAMSLDAHHPNTVRPK